MPNKIYCCNDDFSSIVAPKCQPSILQVSIEAHVDRHHLQNTTQTQTNKEKSYGKSIKAKRDAQPMRHAIPETNSSPSFENSMALTQPKCATKFVRYKFLTTASLSRNKFERKLCTLLPNWRLTKCDTAFEPFNFARAIMKCGLVFCFNLLFCIYYFMIPQCINNEM